MSEEQAIHAVWQRAAPIGRRRCHSTRPASLLRLGPDPFGSVHQGPSGAARPQVRRGDLGHLRPPHGRRRRPQSRHHPGGLGKCCPQYVHSDTPLTTFPQVRGLEREELACRPGSVPGGLAANRGATIHLGPPLPAASCGLPAHSGGPPSNMRAPVALTSLPGTPASRPCSGRGLPRRTGHPGRWWSLAPPFRPYPHRPRSTRAVCSLWHFPRVTPGGCCPPPCPAEPGPSSAPSVTRGERGRPASSSARSA